LNGANLAGVDLRAADLTDIEFEHLENIAGADFSKNVAWPLEKSNNLAMQSWVLLLKSSARQKPSG
jgi:Pentapeptide repeats (8 copies)